MTYARVKPERVAEVVAAVRILREYRYRATTSNVADLLDLPLDSASRYLAAATERGLLVSPGRRGIASAGYRLSVDPLPARSSSPGGEGIDLGRSE